MVAIHVPNQGALVDELATDLAALLFFLFFASINYLQSLFLALLLSLCFSNIILHYRHNSIWVKIFIWENIGHPVLIHLDLVGFKFLLLIWTPRGASSYAFIEAQFSVAKYFHSEWFVVMFFQNLGRRLLLSSLNHLILSAFTLIQF